MNRLFFRLMMPLALCMGMAVALCSCSNDTSGASRLAMLTGGSSKTWYMISDSSYTGLASNPCLLDNDYVFDTAGNFTNRDNGIRCNADEDRELRAQWTLDDDSVMLSFGPGMRMHITQLSDTLMIIEELAPPHGKPERKSVFVAKK